MSGLFKWVSRRADPPQQVTADVATTPEVVAASKVLPKFLAVISRRPHPVLLDLGPVVGENVSFFGERLACKIKVEDLYNEVDRCARQGTPEALAGALLARLPDEEASVDAVLCWDVFDYLDRQAGQALAARLIRVLRPGGALYAFFGTVPSELTHHTRFIVCAEDAFRYRTSPAAPVRRTVLVPRDINRLFEGLKMTETVLLKSSSRETLFRKPE